MTRVYSLKPASAETLPEPIFRIDYAKELNQSQLDAVTTLNGPLLCLAGAGSGKTRTLVFRVARMIESGIPPDSILLLTFTRKAAAQMLLRAEELVGATGTRVAGGTYHSFANTILRKYGSTLGFPPTFSILDEPDSCDIINLARTELGMNKRETRFPLKKTLKEMFSKVTNTGWSLEEVIEREFAHFLEHTDSIKTILLRYEAYKKANFLLDYDDLLIYLYRLLADHSAVRERLSQKYRYLLVDEYQDTNLLQAQITELLARSHRNVMVVGDDAQSIYSFRGAQYKNIHEFPTVFPEAKIITLEENYRSHGAILSATNQLMKCATQRFEKNLFTRLPEGEKPALVACSDEEEQSGFIAQRILELREEGVALSDIAVLFRSGFHAFQLELELRKRNIPYVKWGGFKFLEAAHVKDLVAHLRVLLNPLDFVSWQRILLLVEGVGTKSIPVLFEQIKQAADPFALETLSASTRMKAGLAKLGQTMKKASQALSNQGSVQTVVGILADYYTPLLKAMYDDYPKRLRDLDQVAIICGKYDSLPALLTDFALEPPSNSIDETLAPENDDDETLILSTIHSAKGLEWHSVFILWTLEGRFPSFQSLKDKDSLEEERRLMYVAMTRAKSNLFLTYPVRFWDPISGEVLSRPSRFVEEIGEPFLEKWLLQRS